MDEKEFYLENIYPKPGKFTWNRSEFLKLTTVGLGGLIVFFKAGNGFGLPLEGDPVKRTLPDDFNAFLQITEEGKVNCLTGKIEMGQGVITSLAQMLADELDVCFDDVNMVMGDTDLCPYDAGTWGSLSIRIFGPAMLTAAAEARHELIALAAKVLNTTTDQLQVKEGVVSKRNDPSIKVSYATLSAGKRIEKMADGKAEPKSFNQHLISGKSIKRSDAVAKVKGSALFAGDYQMPGMLYAKILRPPSHGAKLITVDTSEAKKIAGIIVIEENDIVAVLHENTEVASLALRQIKVEYSFDEKAVSNESIFDYLLNSGAEARIVHEKGDPVIGRKNSLNVFESTFYNSYVAHSPIETHTALAYEENDRLIAVVSTQSPFGVQEMLARELKLPLEKVRVITPFVGGAFGGKAPARQALEASKLTRLCQRPVMVQWTREEEFFYDTFRPAAVVRIASGLDDQQRIRFWDFNEYYAGSRGSDTVYDVPDQCTMSHSARNVHPLGTGAWRAPGNNTNTFARESHIDMMAHSIGMDPLEFRLKNLTDKRMLAVLNAVAKLFEYTPAQGPSGRGFGIACGFDAGSYVAHMAEVKVNTQTGEVEVSRVACAQDMGYCVNPHGSIMQIESCIIMGMGYALTEEVEFEGGAIHTSNFGKYKIPLFSWIPKIQTNILELNEPMQGGGEPAIICMGGVLANAVFDACGARLMQLPMTPVRILEALRKL